MTVFRDLQSNARRHGAPVSFVLIAAMVACFLLSWLTQDRFFAQIFFLPAQFQSRPWSIVTYPFANSGADLIGIAFGCLMIWWFGASVERELGGAKYVGFFLAMTLLPVAFLSLGGALGMPQPPLFAPYLPLSGVIVAWATRNPTATILLAFVIPVLAKWIGWLTVVAVFFGYGFGAPLMGLFAILHLGLAYAYAANKIGFLPWGASASFGGGGRKKQGWLPRERDDKYFDEVKKREKEREERERLRKLFEGSLKDDDGQDR